MIEIEIQIQQRKLLIMIIEELLNFLSIKINYNSKLKTMPKAISASKS